MTEVTETKQAGTPEAPVLGISDIRNAIAAIDYACEQGAYKGWNVIQQIMGIRSKLAAFVDAVAPVPAPAATETKTEEQNTTPTSEQPTEQEPGPSA